MTRTPLRRALLAIGGGAGAAAAFAALVAAGSTTQACYTHQCDALSVTRGLGPDGGIVGTGEVVSREGNDVKWESGPLVPPDGGAWLPFNGMQTYTFVFPPDAGLSTSDIFAVTPFIATSPDPLGASAEDAGATLIPGTGQLDEFASATGDRISVTNETCANYFLRLAIEFILPDAGPADASPGGELDAAADAP